MRDFLEPVLMRAWQRRGLLAWMLWPFSALYGLLTGFRFGLYALGYKTQTRLPVPVIVVGNIFVGGTGKTPFTIWLVEQLRAAGYTPGLISRGYGADTQAVTEVQRNSRANEVGDEPLLLAMRTACPVFVGRRRVAAAQALLERYPAVDVIISDDGLQHYALGRDIEILLFDARGTGNGWLLPAGPLRETTRRRYDFRIMNGDSQSMGDTWHMQLMPAPAYQLNDPAQQRELRSFQSCKAILAAAGIGNPQRFFGSLQAAGLQCQTLALPDHFDFNQNPFQHLSAEIILITEKDAVKCRQMQALAEDTRIWVVPVSARLDAELAAKIGERLLEKQHGRTLA